MQKQILIILLGLFLAVPFSFADDQKKAPPDTKILLERTACFGFCPIYKLTIYGDGKIEFDGKNYVNAIGHHVKTISPEKVAMMLTELESINLKGKYDCYDATDNPTAIITVTREGKTKQIVHYHGCLSADAKELAALTKLENKIDELAEIADWLKYEKNW